MMIVKLEKEPSGFHRFESQSHRTEVWQDGYIAVPEDLEENILSCVGFCELVVEDGVLTGVVPMLPNVQVEPEPPTESEDAASLLVDHEYRLTLLELGVI